MTIRYLAEFIRQNDCKPEQIRDYFLKLAEEVGELSRAIRHDRLFCDTGEIKGSIDEEIWDVIYYALAIANCKGIDVERAIREKEAVNARKYADRVPFDPD